MKLRSTAASERLNGSLAAAGGLNEPGKPLAWRGELRRLMLDTPDIEPLRLRAPARVAYVDGDFTIGSPAWSQDQAALCMDADIRKNGGDSRGLFVRACAAGPGQCVRRRGHAGTIARRSCRQGQHPARRGWPMVWQGEHRIRLCPHGHARRGSGHRRARTAHLLLYENLKVQAHSRAHARPSNSAPALHEWR